MTRSTSERTKRQQARSATRELIRGHRENTVLREETELDGDQVESLHGRLIDAVEEEIYTTLKETEA